MKMNYCRKDLYIATLVVLFLASPMLHSQGLPDVVSYTRMYADETGVSHFSDEGVPFGDVSEVGGRVTSWTPTTLISYVTLPVGFDQDWHPAPNLQWCIILSGIIEIEVGDGEVRRFTSGDIFTTEDTTGQGHKTRVIGSEPGLGTWIQFDPK
jgi:hypothetical protein